MHMSVPGAYRARGLLMVQYRDEATAHERRQCSKSLDSGASVWRGMEDSRYEHVW